MRFAGFRGCGFNRIRVDGALSQELDTADIASLLIEYIDKGIAEEQLFRVHKMTFTPMCL